MTDDRRGSNEPTAILQQLVREALYAARQWTEFAPVVIARVHDARFRAALWDHLQETRRHARRLTALLGQRGWNTRGATCDLVEIAIDRVQRTLESHDDGPRLEVALIPGLKVVEHLGMATHESLLALAEALQFADVAGVIGEILDDEVAANLRLSSLAIGHLNPLACDAGDDSPADD